MKRRRNGSWDYFVELTYPGGQKQKLGPYATKADAQRGLRWQLRGGWRGPIRVVKDRRAVNPAGHVRRVSKTGWLKARAVRIVREDDRTVVQIKRSAKRRKR